MTKKEIKALAKKLEEITGIKCINVNQLRHNAPLEMWQDAWEKDRNWFRGLADTIYENT